MHEQLHLLSQITLTPGDILSVSIYDPRKVLASDPAHDSFGMFCSLDLFVGCGCG